MIKTDNKISLSTRELQVLTYLAQSFSNKEIADILGVTHHTVKAHVAGIIHKLGARNRLEAVMKALNMELINLHQD